MANYLPADTDLDSWAERNRLAGEYLPRIATSYGVERQKLICELVSKLFDEWTNRRLMLVKTLYDIPALHDELGLTLSMIVMPHLSPVPLDESEREAVDVTIAGRSQSALHQALIRLLSLGSIKTARQEATLGDNRSGYEAMMDCDLEDLMVTYRIPPAKRVDEHGESFYFDREQAIDALVNRDASGRLMRDGPASWEPPADNQGISRPSRDTDAVRDPSDRTAVADAPVFGAQGAKIDATGSPTEETLSTTFPKQSSESNPRYDDDLPNAWAVVPQLTKDIVYGADPIPHEMAFQYRTEAESWYNEQIKDFFGWQEPVPVVSLKRAAYPFSGQRLSEFFPLAHVESAKRVDLLTLSMDDHFQKSILPISCHLSPDWRFAEIAAATSRRAGYVIEGRKIVDSFRQLMQVAHDLEAGLFLIHPTIAQSSVLKFWRSWPVARFIAQFCRDKLVARCGEPETERERILLDRQCSAYVASNSYLPSGAAFISESEGRVASTLRVDSANDTTLRQSESSEEPGRTEPAAPKKRGRKSSFTSDQLEIARQMKKDGKRNNEIAKVLYKTCTPTPEQRRSVPTTLKHHFGSKK